MANNAPDELPVTRIYHVHVDRGYKFKRRPFDAEVHTDTDLILFVSARKLEQAPTQTSPDGKKLKKSPTYHQVFLLGDVVNPYFDLDDRCESQEEAEAQLAVFKKWALETLPKLLLPDVPPSKIDRKS